MDLSAVPPEGQALAPIVVSALGFPSRFSLPTDAGGNTIDFDTFGILAQIYRESGFGDFLQPKGFGGLGDAGHGHGGCQFDDRPPRSSVPAEDIYRDANGLGNWEWIASGAMWAEPELAIPRMVDQLRWATYQLGDLWAGVAAYNCGVTKVRPVVLGWDASLSVDAKIALLDPLTAPPKSGEPGNYVSYVSAHRLKFMGAT